MRAVAIIQARMGSSRMPGKVLENLAGKPILWHIVHRLRSCARLDNIALATSTAPSDDALAVFAREEGIPLIRGPEDNVLQRYVLAAEQLDADIIVRITGDAPFVDPGFIDQAILAMLAHDADFCTVDPSIPCIHEGIDPFSRRALNKLVSEAADDPTAREHVTAYFKQHPGFAHTIFLELKPEYRFGLARLSVDTPSDLAFLETIHARLGTAPGDADVRAVVRLLKSCPELLKINGHVHQKEADALSRSVLLRCDGDAALGLGHVFRCLGLAEELRERHGCGVVFAVARGRMAADIIRFRHFAVEEKPATSDEARWTADLIRRLRPHILVLDIRTDISHKQVQGWRQPGMLTVLLDDASPRRVAADLVFYPPVPQVDRLDWRGFQGTCHTGWEWAMVRTEFAQAPPRAAQTPPVVLVTMGGSDPTGFTLSAVKALDSIDLPFTPRIVLGPAFYHTEELGVLLSETSHPFKIYRNVGDMAALMAETDLAVASFGTTAFELAAMGVPTCLLCLNEDHALSASAFVRAGMAICPTGHTRPDEKDIASAVRSLLMDENRRTRMSLTARKTVDGKGFYRMAEAIAHATALQDEERRESLG